METVLSLVEAYDPKGLNLQSAMFASQMNLITMIQATPNFSPVELKIIIEQGISARLDYIVGMLLAAIMGESDWSEGQLDQEARTVSDSLSLIKSHVEAMTVAELVTARTEGKDDEDEEV